MTENDDQLVPRVGQLVRYRAHTYTNVPQSMIVPTYVRASKTPDARGACFTGDLTQDPETFVGDGFYVETATERLYIANADVLAVGETEQEAKAGCILAEYDRIVRFNEALHAVATDEDGLYGAWGEVLQTAAEWLHLAAPIPWHENERSDDERTLHDALWAAWLRYRAEIRKELGID